MHKRLAIANRLRCRCAAALLCAAAPLTGHGEDLLDLYHAARGGDPVLSAADAARGVVREGVAQARAPLLPQVSAGLGFNESHVGEAASGSLPSDRLADRNRSRSVSASLSQIVVDVGRLATLRAAEAQADAQDARYRAAEQALCVRVASAYFGVLTASDALSTTLANEGAFRQQVEQAEQRYRNGLSALVDLEQARAFHATARSNTLAARTALADAREALAEISGVAVITAVNSAVDAAPATLKTLRNDLPLGAPSPDDPQAWVEAATRNHPLLQAQRRALDAAEQSIAAASAGHLPTLSAGVDIGRSAGWPQPLSNTDGRNVTTLGLSLKVPLFAGGATQSQIRQALYQRDGTRDELERQRRQIARDTLAHYRSVVAGIGQIEATRQAVDAASKALASTRVGQQLGTQTFNDLLFAIQNLAAAQGSYSAVRHAFVLNRLLLLQDAGTVGEADLAAVNALLE